MTRGRLPLSRVPVGRYDAIMGGKKAQFTDAENALLAAELRTLLESATQREAADVLHIRQQNVSALSKGRSGFGRATANRLAAHLGYGSAELFLIMADIERTMASKPRSGWALRDAAKRLATVLGYDEAAVEAVVQRYVDDEAKERPVKWWVLRFGDEEREQLADKAARKR